MHGHAVATRPRIAGDKVVIGTAGGEYFIRGFIAAYNVKDGKLAWKFHTVPPPPGQKPEDEAQAAALQKQANVTLRAGQGEGAIVRLKDVARLVDDAENLRLAAWDAMGDDEVEALRDRAHAIRLFDVISRLSTKSLEQIKGVSRSRLVNLPLAAAVLERMRGLVDTGDIPALRSLIRELYPQDLEEPS